MIALSSLQLAPRVQTVSHIVRQLAASFEGAHHVSIPFDYWLLSDILPERAITDILALPFAAAQKLTFDGRRESNNSWRIFFSPENQARYPICGVVAEAFNAALVVDALGLIVGRELSGGKLRIEYCQDTDGFWLEPHRHCGQDAHHVGLSLRRPKFVECRHGHLRRFARA